jgi:DNA-binding NarL/FixJ family response regulator
MNSSRPRVLIADDHVIFADALVRLLGTHYDVVATITDGSQLREAVAQFAPELILLDISMPRMSGLEALRRLKTNRHRARVILLTMHPDARLAVEAYRLGAHGFVLKQSSGDELLTAIEAVMAGRTYLSLALRDEFERLTSEPGPRGIDHLTTQQREVLRLTVKGLQMKEIAVQLDLSTHTVRSLRSEMMRALHMRSTGELVRYAIERQLVTF